ncbi:hypothetical protein BDW66DRAFT_12312 [Aspergillus desertorum]
MSRGPEKVLGRSKRKREEEETSRKWNGGLCVRPRAEDTDTFESIGSSRRGYLLQQFVIDRQWDRRCLGALSGPVEVSRVLWKESGAERAREVEPEQQSQFKQLSTRAKPAMSATYFAGLDRNRSRSSEFMEGRTDSGLKEHGGARRHSCEHLLNNLLQTGRT